MKKEKFLQEVNRLKVTNTNLKAHKITLGSIDDILDSIDRMDWDNKLQSVYDIYSEAYDYSESVKNTASSEYDSIDARLRSVENTLEELGLEPTGDLLEAQNEMDKIQTQINGLTDDLNSGVLF